MICTTLIKYSGDQIKEDEIGRTRGTHGREEKYVLAFGVETRKEETTWKT
jgi:hypothetical protein